MAGHARIHTTLSVNSPLGWIHKNESLAITGASFNTPEAFLDAQPSVSKHSRHNKALVNNNNNGDALFSSALTLLIDIKNDIWLHDSSPQQLPCKLWTSSCGELSKHAIQALNYRMQRYKTQFSLCKWKTHNRHLSAEPSVERKLIAG